MELSELLSKAGSLPEAQQRKVAAILGSLVADAAGKKLMDSTFLFLSFKSL
jgi:hypothetical protein